MPSSNFKILLPAAVLSLTAITRVSGFVMPYFPGEPIFDPHAWKPVMPDNFADPAIINVDGIDYAFATTTGGANVPIAQNTNGKWAIMQSNGKAQDIMPNLPPWTTGGIWAPDVVQTSNGSFVLYFSGTAQPPNDAHHCVGAAVATTVTGPYTPVSTPLACPTASGGAIDPAGFTDSDNTPYVVYKIDGNSLPGGGGPCGNGNGKHSTPIMIQKLQPDATTPDGDPVQLLDRDKIDGPLIEAPSLIKSGDGTYVLSFSSNCYNGPLYDSSYATASSVLGPYSKSKTPLLLPGDHGLMSPGGLSFKRDGKSVVFHADQKYSNAAVRQMFVQGVSFSGTKVTVG